MGTVGLTDLVPNVPAYKRELAVRTSSREDTPMFLRLRALGCSRGYRAPVCTGDRSRGQSLGQGSRGKREAATTGSCRSPSLEGTGVSSLKEEGLVIAGHARGLRALAAP